MKKKIISALCIAGCALTLTSCANKTEKLLGYIDKMDFEGAMDYYDDKIDGSDKEREIRKEIGRKMRKKYDKILEAYNNGEIELKDLDDLYKLAEELDLDEDDLADFKADIEELSASKESYKQALDMLDEEDFDEAEKLLKLVIKDDANYDAAKAKLDELDDLRFDKAFEGFDEYLENNDYEECVDMLYFSNRYDEKKIDELIEKLKNSVIEYGKNGIAEHIEADDYDGAVSFIKDLRSLVYEYAGDELDTLKDNIDTDYANHIVEKADKLHAEKKYQECLDLLKKTSETITADSITEAIEKYKVYVPCHITDFDWEIHANGELTWLNIDKILTDTSGNEYQHSLYTSANSIPNLTHQGFISSADTILDGKFTKVTGVVAPSMDVTNLEEYSGVSIVAQVSIQKEKDGAFETVYTSPAMTTDSKPEKFEVDVTGAYAIRLSYPNPEVDYTNFIATFFDVCLINEDKDTTQSVTEKATEPVTAQATT